MLKHIIRKEFQQIRRDRRMLPIIFIAPMLQLVLLGYAASFDVKNIQTVICDNDRTPESRDYVTSFFSGEYFEHVAELADCGEADSYLDRGEADVAVVVPAGFGKAMRAGDNAGVQAIVNGSDTNSAGVGLNYVAQINNRYAGDILVERIARLGNMRLAFIELEDRVWYNPELRSRNYMVPAILALLLMIMTMMLTAMAVVREKEIGTMEQLVVTPVRKHQIIIGKLFPFAIIGLIDVALVTAVAVFWFQVPFKGSFLLLYVLSVPFLLNTLGLGLLVSTISNTQQQAMMTIMFFVMMPFIYFSGFAFPIENMPEIAQYLTYGVPLRYFLEIVRGIFLKGVGLESLWDEAAILTAMGVGILALAIARFRKHV